MRFLYPKANAVVAVSNGVKTSIENLLRGKKANLCVIYNAVISSELYDLSSEEVEYPFVKEENSPVILSIGRLEPQKDYITLIKSFAKIRSKQKCKLVILGSGSLLETLENLAQSLGLKNDVVFLGFVDNPYPYLKNCDLFVLSSVFEGLAIVLVEALALAPRLVSTDCPSGPYEVLEGGRHGYLVKPKSADDLADAMEKSLSDAPGNPSKRNLERFYSENILDQYIKILVPKDEKN